MFTGLVEGMGRIRRADLRGGEMVLSVEPLFLMDRVRTGDSLCVSGVCLTVTGQRSGVLSMDVSAETLSCSTLGGVGPGDRVNLERALRLSDRLGGHLVSGHVDGIGRIARKEARQGSWLLEIEFDPALSRYTIEKGSIAVDGVSLTINRCRTGRVELNIIPQTGRETTLLGESPGGRVNIETDLIGKYVEKLMSGEDHGRGKKAASGISVKTLYEHGFIG
ncbi:MAG: riboflavin synthase [Thermodesulfobacteriota bacterium]